MLHNDIIITTYGSDTRYTQMCLNAISKWKNDHHHITVVCHDETPLLRAYLKHEYSRCLIENLIFATSEHGHTRSFNLGVKHSSGDVIFNVSNDVMVGPVIVDDCAWKLRNNKQLGMIGTHWKGNGVTWLGNAISDFTLKNDRELDEITKRKITTNRYFTGRLFKALGKDRNLALCNTSFFGIRREVLEEVGGGFSQEFKHLFADDFLNYLVLDQGYNTHPFDRKFNRQEFIQTSKIRRHEDSLEFNLPFVNLQNILHGLSIDEIVYLYLLGHQICPNKVITLIGAQEMSLITILESLHCISSTINVIDTFNGNNTDGLGTQDSIRQWASTYVTSDHQLNIIKGNAEKITLPRSDMYIINTSTLNLERVYTQALKRRNEGGMILIRNEKNQSFSNNSCIPQIYGMFTLIADEPTREEYIWD